MEHTENYYYKGKSKDYVELNKEQEVLDFYFFLKAAFQNFKKNWFVDWQQWKGERLPKKA